MNEYLVDPLYKRLKRLVTTAFRMIYPEEGTWVDINSINLDYISCDDEADEMPYITVEVNYKGQGIKNVTLQYLINRSDEFNIGLFYSVFDKNM